MDLHRDARLHAFTLFLSTGRLSKVTSRVIIVLTVNLTYTVPYRFPDKKRPRFYGRLARVACAIEHASIRALRASFPSDHFHSPPSLLVIV